MRVGTIALALTAAGVAAVGAGPAGAQATPAPAGATPAGLVPGCTYDTCALRRERVFFGDRIVVGLDGRVVGRPVFGVLPAEQLVRAVPEAVPYARTYRREAVLGQTLTAVSTVLGVVAFVDALNARGGSCTVIATSTTNTSTGVTTTQTQRCRVGNYDRQLALAGGALVVGGLGGWRLQISDRALNRAIWYYNRRLAR